MPSEGCSSKWEEQTCHIFCTLLRALSHPNVCYRLCSNSGDRHEAASTCINELRYFLQIMLGVDRLDMIKGIPQKLLAFEKFLEEHPDWRDKVLLVQIAVPTRGDVPEYQAHLKSFDPLPTKLVWNLVICLEMCEDIARDSSTGSIRCWGGRSFQSEMHWEATSTNLIMEQLMSPLSYTLELRYLWWLKLFWACHSSMTPWHNQVSIESISVRAV